MPSTVVIDNLTGVSGRASFDSGSSASHCRSSGIYDEINSILMDPDHDVTSKSMRIDGRSNVAELRDHYDNRAFVFEQARVPTRDDYGFVNNLCPPDNESFT